MGFCDVEYLRILWGILPCCEQLRGGSGWGQEVKKCIIVHVEGGFWQKVHYNALFGRALNIWKNVFFATLAARKF
jgi:hypothetical protein